MKQSLYILGFICGTLLLPLSGFGQFTVTGEFRPTAEVRDGYRYLSSDKLKPAYLISQRTRVGFFYEHEWIKTGVSFQDVRLWGDETVYSSTGVQGDLASIDLNEAWVQLSFLKKSSLKIGRQYFNYDDTRLLSNRNWNNYSIKYDALLYQYTGNKLIIDAAVSYNNQVENYFGNFYTHAKMKTLNFVHASYKINERFNAALIAIATGYTKSDTTEMIYVRATYGVIANYKTEKTTAMASVYLQNGRNDAGIKANAYNANIKAMSKVGKFNLGAGISIISGDDAIDLTTDNMFDLHYGNRHSYYGHMDFFTSMPKATNNGGLNDFFLSTQYKLDEKTTLSADYHYFTLNQDVKDKTFPTSTVYLDKGLGSEVDLNFNIKLHKIVELNGGYSFMLPTSSMLTLQNIAEADKHYSSWIWLQMVVKPVFFSNK
ncbi:MAG: alginate export family protein [Bacteroidales bacterium]|nr:alginate export family protein [Bacteroidales bacterium]